MHAKRTTTPDCTMSAQHLHSRLTSKGGWAGAKDKDPGVTESRSHGNLPLRTQLNRNHCDGSCIPLPDQLPRRPRLRGHPPNRKKDAFRPDWGPRRAEWGVSLARVGCLQGRVGCFDTRVGCFETRLGCGVTRLGWCGDPTGDVGHPTG